MPVVGGLYAGRALAGGSGVVVVMFEVRIRNGVRPFGVVRHACNDFVMMSCVDLA